MASKILILVTCLCMFYCVSDTESGVECDKQSNNWDNATHSKLLDKCEPLSYDKQYCTVDHSKLDCMRQRANMHDMTSCECHKKQRFWGPTPCLYLEVCAFADPNFKCDMSYLCNVGEDDQFNCTAPNFPTYTNKCIRGFIHCSKSESRCQGENTAYDYTVEYQEHCGKTLTDVFGTNVTIYFIDRALHDGSNDTFMNITALRLAEGDKDNPCKLESFTYPIPTHNEDWKIVVPILIVFLIVITLLFGGWKFWQKRKRENKKLDELMDHTFNRVRDYVISTPERSETQERTTSDDPEIPDPIPPEGIPLPHIVEEDDILEDASAESISENPPPQVRDDSSPDDFCDLGNSRLHSYDNSSYYERLIRPSVASVFSGYSSKYSPELFETCSVDKSATTCSTVSGYSMKNSASLLGSVGQDSNSGFAANDEFPGHNHLKVISESDISEPFGDGESRHQNSSDHNQANNGIDSNSLLRCNPTNFDNPMYMK